MTNTPGQNVWILVFPAEDLTGTWLAHCLDLDVMSFGGSVREALDNVRTTSFEVIANEIEHGRDPFARRARVEDTLWNTLNDVVKRGEPIQDLATLETNDLTCLVTQARIHIHRAPLRPPAEARPTPLRVHDPAADDIRDVPFYWATANCEASA